MDGRCPMQGLSWGLSRAPCSFPDGPKLLPDPPKLLHDPPASSCWTPQLFVDPPLN